MGHAAEAYWNRPPSPFEAAQRAHLDAFGVGAATWGLEHRGRDAELVQAIMDAVRDGAEFDAVAFRKRFGWGELSPGALG